MLLFTLTDLLFVPSSWNIELLKEYVKQLFSISLHISTIYINVYLFLFSYLFLYDLFGELIESSY